MSDKIDNKLKSKEVRPTAMRELVLKVLTEKGTATSLKALESEFANADKSTLYRTLKTFEKSKVIHSVDDGTGSIKYAVCQDTCECNPSDLHVHFHCIKCKETYCLPEIPIPEIKLPKGYSLNKANFVVKGICEYCDKSNF